MIKLWKVRIAKYNDNYHIKDEDFDEVITSVLVDRAEDYIRTKDYADKNSLDGEITFNGGSW